jgi:hypothetical protein
MKWSKEIMDLKMEVKLGKLLQLCPQLYKLLEIFLAKIKGKEVVDVCKITISKAEDFNKATHVIQVRVGKLGVKDVVLDGGFIINIISKELRKKLGLMRPQLAPFMVSKEGTTNWTNLKL